MKSTSVTAKLMLMADVIRPTDDEARAQARDLLAEARHAALGVILPDGSPFVSRIALASSSDSGLLTLVSDLAPHTGALRQNPTASLMVGEPGGKGDVLAYPRLTVQVQAAFVGRDDPEHAQTKAIYLDLQPKAALYIDFADFHLVRLSPTSAALNGGFGRAYHLKPEDIF